jgi:hypothetical protein
LDLLQKKGCINLAKHPKGREARIEYLKEWGASAYEDVWHFRRGNDNAVIFYADSGEIWAENELPFRIIKRLQDNKTKKLNINFLDKYADKSPIHNGGSAYEFKYRGITELLGNTQDGFAMRVRNTPESYYDTYHEYYPNENIKKSGAFNSEGYLKLGIWKYYDENGRLTKEIDETPKAKFTYDNLWGLMREEMGITAPEFVEIEFNKQNNTWHLYSTMHAETENGGFTKIYESIINAENGKFIQKDKEIGPLRNKNISEEEKFWNTLLFKEKDYSDYPMPSLPTY